VGGYVERRRCVRFRLSVPVVYRWRDRSKAKYEHAGLTRDIGAAGVYVICRVLPPNGAKVTLEVQLPSLEGETSRSFRLNAKGTVTRVEETGQETGFAAASPFKRLALIEKRFSSGSEGTFVN
jgi:hypothetical protein